MRRDGQFHGSAHWWDITGYASSYVGFEIGGFELGLDPDITGVNVGNNAVAYWGVGDIDDAYERLLDCGAQARNSVKDVGGDTRVASVADPFGNVIGLIHSIRRADTAVLTSRLAAALQEEVHSKSTAFLSPCGLPAVFSAPSLQSLVKASTPEGVRLSAHRPTSFRSRAFSIAVTDATESLPRTPQWRCPRRLTAAFGQT